MDLISVIVPIYKVEAYLDRCVQSIVDQTYPNLEIILVDDGSPDRCPAMCDVWAEKDKRIKVIHKENGGLSDARNAGMALAKGEFMGFVDSDDYIAPEMYQLLLARIHADGSDIAACGVQLAFEDGSSPHPLTAPGNHLLTQSEAMQAIIAESVLKQPVWYKLYRTQLVQDIPFPVGKYHEDVFWSYLAIARARLVSVLDTPCYFYVQRAGSIMGATFSAKRFDALEAKCLRQKYLESYYPACASISRLDLHFFCLYLGQMSLIHFSKDEQAVAFHKIRIALQKHPLTRSDRHVLPLKQRLWKYLPIKFTCNLRNLLRIGI